MYLPRLKLSKPCRSTVREIASNAPKVEALPETVAAADFAGSRMDTDTTSSARLKRKQPSLEMTGDSEQRDVTAAGEDQMIKRRNRPDTQLEAGAIENLNNTEEKFPIGDGQSVTEVASLIDGVDAGADDEAMGGGYGDDGADAAAAADDRFLREDMLAEAMSCCGQHAVDDCAGAHASVDGAHTIEFMDSALRFHRRYVASQIAPPVDGSGENSGGPHD